MLELFRAFSLRCTQIEDAIRVGDDQRVTALDRHVEPLVEAILAHRAVNLLEVYMQLQFVSHLISQDADDSASVTEHTTVLSYLLDRYFGTHGPDWRVPSPQDVRIEPPAAYVPDTDNGQFLNAAILETLPDRVAVLTRDYRYLYSNPANCADLDKKPMELIGRHLSEFIGEELFAACAKYKLDACFAGEQVDYAYECPGGGAGSGQVRCRMSPLRDAGGTVIGALLVMEDIDRQRAIGTE
ncbi:PAS domain-containing protein [Rhizobium sp. NZLR3b]|uniref:PAS domain-containing protein n=1 Tax=unclassified Rhizobium TaxID=2613769 RepID=UPI001C82E120|nr:MULTISPECIES: PAS domain-containing protein [unclassified Rhizobium]MBX5161159.1 PAS domain-containing protein [Rhizobium sp. NZLR8]MBX5190670.1 PAS domain-containing protein [Rhizobium sp. NZLR3b]